jgi:putative Ca2+/H+ antiporter (TMEM165/GDT1 family)
MFWKAFFTVFVSVFLAELGDKTQLSTMLYSTDKEYSKLAVFFGSSTALVLSSLLAVFAGSYLSEYVSPQMLKIVAGVGFILIGLWVIFS